MSKDISTELNDKIEFTKRAAKRLSAILKAENKTDHGLRVEVISGGCSGMNYNMTFDNEKKEFDKVFESQGLKIYCDLKSWLYLKGVQVDFSDDMLSGGFQIINPNAKRTCGCGTSFSV